MPVKPLLKEEEDEMAELLYKKYHLPSAEGRVSPSGGASSREGKLLIFAAEVRSLTSAKQNVYPKLAH